MYGFVHRVVLKELLSARRTTASVLAGFDDRLTWLLAIVIGISKAVVALAGAFVESNVTDEDMALTSSNNEDSADHSA
jgi:ATP/ADP translocase